MNPVDELTRRLPPAPAERALPQADERKAELLAAISGADGGAAAGRWPARWQQAARGRQQTHDQRLGDGRRAAMTLPGTGPRPVPIRARSQRLARAGARPGTWPARRVAAPSAVVIAVLAVATLALVVPRLVHFGASSPAPVSPAAHHPAGSPSPGGSTLTAAWHWTVPAARFSRVVVVSNTGSVVVTGESTTSAGVTATPRYDGTAPVLASTVSGGTLTIKATCPGNELCRVTVQLAVPARDDVSASSGQGGVQLTGLSGGATTASGQGDISLTRLTGKVTATDGQGDISARTMHGTLTARDGQGDIQVTGLTGQLTASSQQGDVTLSQITGTVAAHSGQGTVSATGLAVSQASLTTQQGDVSASFVTAPRLVVATTQLSSVSLRLPGGTSYAVAARASMGSMSITVPQSARSRHVVRASSQLGSVSVTG